MSEEDKGDVKGIWSSAFLVAAVGLVLIIGMFLRAGAPANTPNPGAQAPPAPPLLLGSTITPDLVPAAPVETVALSGPKFSPPDDPLVVKLAARAEGDCGRLAKTRERWTAQLIVACKPETVDRMLGLARGSNSLYVLPVEVNSGACFRVCFGAYQTSKQAALASDLPKALRSKEKIGAVEIAKVLP